MRIRLRAIDQVDTEARRSIKRGGRVRYTYLTTVRGRDTKLTFASNAAGYPEIVRELLPRLPDDVLDSRSIDLRDHLVQPGEADRRAAEANIPPADVLEGSLIAKDLTAARPAAEPVDRERAQELRAIGNELKVAGSLARAVEAFRRALRFGSDDAWLLFDFARCIKSLAAAEDSPDLDRKSIALMRLAERRAGSDSELLSRLGEVYFQAGEWRRAAVVFARAVEPKRASFRAFRGMAEVALRDGKIAHVIHNFAAAHRLAANPALRRWSRDEMDYFSRLNDDEDFLEMEISRITLLDKLATARRVTLRAALFGFPPIAAGFAVGSEVLTQIGWTISTLGVLLWMFATGLRRLMAERMPVERA
jgi:tetratricopeptide (TPR) repeat protein